MPVMHSATDIMDVILYLYGKGIVFGNRFEAFLIIYFFYYFSNGKSDHNERIVLNKAVKLLGLVNMFSQFLSSFKCIHSF